MKKLLTLLVVSASLLVLNSNANAQEKGSRVLGVGIGLNSYYSGGIPLGAYLEFPVADNITVGPMVDFYRIIMLLAISSLPFILVDVVLIT